MPQSIPKGLKPEHVLKALADLDAGIDNPFGKPTGYVLERGGHRYPPKAVIGLAYRHLTGRILQPSEFSGGEAPGQANYELRRLGFRVVSKEPASQQSQAGKAWSKRELQLIVSDYFDMLQKGFRGEGYSKAEHNRRLRAKLTGRTKGSVEFKHQNISAVLLEMGLPYINGYKPAQNYQRSLFDAVKTYLESEMPTLADLIEKTSKPPEQLPKLGSIDNLFEAPPETALKLGADEPWKLPSGRKIDFAAREAANRGLGRLGEEFTLELEKRRLKREGRDDLAQKVEWISDTRGDGVGFDVLSFDGEDDSERWIEVKTTTLGKYWPFYVSANEVRCSEAEAERYHVYRLFTFRKRPRLYVLHGAISGNCHLDAVQFRALP